MLRGHACQQLVNSASAVEQSGPMPASVFSHKRRAIIIGGSMSGLFTAAFLRRIGWDADVYERSPVELRAATHKRWRMRCTTTTTISTLRSLHTTAFASRLARPSSAQPQARHLHGGQSADRRRPSHARAVAGSARFDGLDRCAELSGRLSMRACLPKHSAFARELVYTSGDRGQ